MATATKTVNYTNPCLEWHMRFICPECGDEFTSQQDWRRHLNETHDYIRKTAKDFDFVEINERYHECQVCHKWVSNARQAIALLQYHRFLHLPFSRTYRCGHCEAAFARKRALCEHLYANHSRIIARMEKLHKAEKAAQAASLRNPKENPEFYLRFLCPQCNKSIDRFQQWLHHLDTAHYATSTDLRMHHIQGTSNHYCKQCKRLFYTSNKARLQRHRFEHLPYKLYFQCAFCTVKKSYKSEVLRHFIRCHPKIFEKAKPYVRKPVEWGSEVNVRLSLELDQLLDPIAPATNKQPTDIIQKALFNSRIDLEMETMDDGAEYALNFDAPNKGSKTMQRYGNTQRKDDTLDLEKLCSVVFDKLDEEDGDDVKGNAFKRKLTPSPTANGVPLAKKALDNGQKRGTVDTKPAGVKKFSPTSRRLEVVNPHPVRSASELSQLHNLKTSVPQVDEEMFNKVLDTYITYICPECGVTFRQTSEWRAHVVNAHNINNLLEKNFRQLDGGRGHLCLTCMEVQYNADEAELQRHRFRHMPHKHYMKCNICGECRPVKLSILEHIRTSHVELCANIRSKLAGMSSKPSATSQQPKYHCTNCGKFYITETRWTTHRRQCTTKLTKHAKTRIYNIEENLRLIAHLKKARLRLKSYLKELEPEAVSA